MSLEWIHLHWRRLGGIQWWKLFKNNSNWEKWDKGMDSILLRLITRSCFDLRVRTTYRTCTTNTLKNFHFNKFCKKKKKFKLQKYCSSYLYINVMYSYMHHIITVSYMLKDWIGLLHTLLSTLIMVLKNTNELKFLSYARNILASLRSLYKEMILILRKVSFIFVYTEELSVYKK